MDIIQSIILGIVQGITEFIPVSSSGHLEIFRAILSINPDNFHLFLECINIGTLLALLIYFRKRIAGILHDVFVDKNFKLAINILLTSIPAGLIGLLLGDLISENPFFGSLVTVSVALGIIGILMIIIDKLPHLKSIPDENSLAPGRALLIGLAQTFALIPGVSRSGSTIIAGRLMGMDSRASAEYSFLASIPIMLAVCLRLFISDSSLAYLGDNLGALLLGNLAAFAFGMLALRFLMKYLKRPGSLQTFGKYRVILSLILLGTLLIIS